MSFNTKLGMPLDAYGDEETGSSVEAKLASLTNWYVTCDFLKTSYPNDIGYLSVPGQYDTSKWVQSLKDLYYLQSNGSSRADALNRVASGWSDSERLNFLSWLRFYESNDHLKYKKANIWYHGSEPGYFLPVKPEDKKHNYPTASSILDVNDARDDLEQLSNKEKKSIIEAQRKKVISRLDSVEKLLRSDQGQLLSGDDFDALIQSIFELKRKINKINKLAKKSTTFSDLIVRQGNILSKYGHNEGASVLYKLADEITAPPAASPSAPVDSIGNPGTLPSDGPQTTQLENNTPDLSKGLQQFLENMQVGNNVDIKDLQDVEDLEVEDEMMVDDFELYSQAQAAPQAIKTQAPPQTTKPQGIIPQTKNVDDMIDGALANISVEDLIDKLQNLAKLFKTREIPRQLAIVDLMMHSLGIAPYFHNLSECINKATESNNYILTRIEDMLGKLTGVIDYDTSIDLTPESKPDTQLSNAVRQQAEKEKARKEMKKELADKALDEQMSSEKEVPEVEIEDAVEPVPTTTAPAAPPAEPKPQAI